MYKVFLICEDSHPDYYVGRIKRKNSELIPEMQELKVGQIYQNQNSNQHFVRES